MISAQGRRLIGLGLALCLALVHLDLVYPGLGVSATEVVAAHQPRARSIHTGPGQRALSRIPAKTWSRPRAFSWPIAGRLTSGFGRRGFWSWHAGVDIAARRGTPIRAAAPGVVRFSGWQSSYGRVIRIAHPDGYTTVYAHNSRNLVKTGDRVERGTVIAAVGHTGHATADHLHFEVRRYGIPRNPLPFLRQQPPVPTPTRHAAG